MGREKGHREDERRLYALYGAGYVRNGASSVQSYQQVFVGGVVHRSGARAHKAVSCGGGGAPEQRRCSRRQGREG